MSNPFRSQRKSDASHILKVLRSLSPTVFLPPLILLLFMLLYALNHLFLLERKVLLFNNQSQLRKHASTPALVTMADPTFQYCASELVKSARNLKWRHAIFMLTIDFQDFDPFVVQQLKTYGVFVVETNPTLDNWLVKSVENRFIYRKLTLTKFRKIELLLNPIFRSFERLIFIDADAILSSSLDPLVNVEFPPNTTLLMRQNDKSMKKRSFWVNEIADNALTDESLSVFKNKYPDRDKSGATCYFIVNVKMLQPPEMILSESLNILCNFRAAFKYNDQTLFNLLYYDTFSMFPWCVWDEVPVIDDSDTLEHFCQRHMPLQKQLNGNLSIIFRHMNSKEKQSCTARQVDGSANGRQDSSNATSRMVELVPSLLDDSKTCHESFDEWKGLLRSTWTSPSTNSSSAAHGLSFYVGP